MQIPFGNRTESLVVFVVILAVCCIGMTDDTATKPGKIDLRILYAGNPGSERMKDFERLLKEKFASVTSTDYRTFARNEAENHDVVIFDWTTTYPRDENGKITWDEDGFSSPQAPKIGRKFGRPAVLIGAAGGGICNQLNIAINWK